jgi:hypothetical protein
MDRQFRAQVGDCVIHRDGRADEEKLRAAISQARGEVLTPRSFSQLRGTHTRATGPGDQRQQEEDDQPDGDPRQMAGTR